MRTIVLAYILLLSIAFSSNEALDSFSRNLTAPAQTNTEKTKLIYTWIAQNISYDLNEYFTGKTKMLYADPAENTFYTRKSVCQGYAELFKRMCSAVSINAVVVNGYSKGYSYDPGRKFSGKPDHAWNAVFLEGKWQLVDPTWGAGYINESKQFVKEYSDYWFLTDPAEFSYTHFPIDQQWQINTPLTLKAFQDFPKFSDRFFQYGLNPQENPHAWFSAKDNMVLIFNVPDNIILSSGLSYWKSSPVKGSYTFERRKGNRVEIMASFPDSGTYELTIYAKNISDPGLYTSVVSYRIDASSGNPSNRFAQTFNKYLTAPVFLDDQSPVFAHLQKNYRYRFKLTVPGADDVAVIRGKDNDWVFLQKNGSTFEGYAEIKPGPVYISARFPNSDNKYSTLLEYYGK